MVAQSGLQYSCRVADFISLYELHNYCKIYCTKTNRPRLINLYVTGFDKTRL